MVYTKCDKILAYIYTFFRKRYMKVFGMEKLFPRKWVTFFYESYDVWLSGK